MKLITAGPLALTLIAQIVNMGTSFVTLANTQNYSKTKTAFRYEHLVKLIKEQNLKSVDDVIPKLPKDLRQNFTLMYDSQSLQRSTTTNPRAILFGTDAKFIVTFGGNPSVAASKSLEIMQFNEATRSFSLHEVSFEDSLPHFATPNEIQGKCFSCHGSSPRPIWSQYKHWVGAYGEHDDIVSIKTSNQAPLPQWDDYQTFRATTAKSPAFKSLYEGHENDRAWPYSQSYKSRMTATMPNFRFNLLLSMLSGQHIAQRVATSRPFPHMKYNLLNNFFCKDNQSPRTLSPILSTHATIPEEENWSGSRHDWEESVQNEYRWLRFFNIAYGATGLHLDRSEFMNPTKTGLTPQGEYGHEIDTDDIAYQYIAKIVAAADSTLKSAHSGVYSYNEFAKDSYKDPVFSGFAQALKNSGLSGKFEPPCEYLKNKAELEIKQFHASSPALSIETAAITSRTANAELGRTVLQNAGCIACHSSGLAPLINFNESISLMDKIRHRISSNNPRERMPLGGRALTTTEQESLLLYLRQIAH